MNLLLPFGVIVSALRYFRGHGAVLQTLRPHRAILAAELMLLA